jgi:cytochrome b561
MDTWEGLAQPVQLAHTILGWSIVVLLVLHVGGALFHHVLRRDGTLLRML